jgi:phosphatidylserine/phosphatidylglycerophosphate/cardiolipin synthase-like enzyme
LTVAPEERVVLAPEERRDAVLDVIRSARQQLILSLFRCDDEAVLEALAEAVRRGVRVRTLLTRRAKGSKKHLKQLRKLLKHLGAEVQRYADSVVKYHAKYIVADDGPALVASLNFTRKCFEDTCDFVLVTHDANLVGGLIQLFEADWCAPASGLPDLQGDRLIVGPEQARPRYTALLQQARHSIRLIDSKVSDAAMPELLKAKEDSGVAVEIRGWGALGLLVPHGKLLIVDDSTAVIGSISLSTLALEFRREVAVVMRNGNGLQQLKEFWNSLPPLQAGSVVEQVAPEEPVP